MSFLFVFAYHCIPTAQTQRLVPNREAGRHRWTLNPQGLTGSASIFILVPLIQKFYRIVHLAPSSEGRVCVCVCSSYYCGCLCTLECVCVCVVVAPVNRKNPAQHLIPGAVVATRSGKHTHSEGQCGQWSAVYYTGGPKAEPLLGQGPGPVFVKTLYTLSVRVQTHLPKFPETSLNKGKERYNQS